jgi:hypothetical protein
MRKPMTICAFCSERACEGLTAIVACEAHWDDPEAAAWALEERARSTQARVEQLAIDLGEQTERAMRAEARCQALATALDKAAGQLGYLSTVLSLSNKTSNAKGAREWSEGARAVLVALPAHVSTFEYVGTGTDDGPSIPDGTVILVRRSRAEA